MGIVQFKDPLIQANDLLSIQVYSKSLNQEQAMLFNLPNTATGGSSSGGAGGGGGGASAGGNAAASGYLVDMSGDVEVALIGKVKAAGLTRTQLNDVLIQKIAPYVKDPGIIVRFLQFRVNVLGEVKQPGTKNFQTDRVTVVDALGAAGDLTDAGKREDITVIREENGKIKYYTIDLRSGTFFQSPVFQLQQNDLVYVGANTNKLKVLNTNPDVQRDIGLGLSIASFLTLLISIINITRK